MTDDQQRAGRPRPRPAPAPPAATTPAQAPASRPRPRPSAAPDTTPLPPHVPPPHAQPPDVPPPPTAPPTAPQTAVVTPPELVRPRPRPATQPPAAQSPAAAQPPATTEPEQPRTRGRRRKQKPGKQKPGNQKPAKQKPEQARKAGRRGARTLVRLAIVVVVAALAAFLLRVYVVEPFYIPSASMEPTLHGCPGCNDDRILVDKLSYRSHGPNVRDVVVFDRPPGDSATESVLVKRVVAVGGDTVSLRNGLVYVNGLKLSEPYINKACGPNASAPLTGQSTWRIPNDDVFVMGDNRCNSHDSRAFGPITDKSVVGRAFAIYWPLNRVGTL